MINVLKSKAFKASLIIGLCISIVISVAGFEAQCEGIRNSVLRLHILANSDSGEDQELKLKIRDSILKEAGTLFDNITDKESAKILAKQNLGILQNIAQNTVYENGYDYGVTVEIGEAYFNTREYSNGTFPAGIYDSLIVTVGKGEGKNWWCVMFPPLCISAATEKVEVDDVLSEEQQEIVQGGSKYKYKFWIVEKFWEVKNFISDIF